MHREDAQACREENGQFGKGFMETELRKHQHTLAVVGTGVIVFGFWDLVKSIVTFTVVNPIMMTLHDEFTMDDEKMYFLYAAIGITIVVLIVGADLLLRWKVGTAARAIAAGTGRVGIWFFVLTSLPVAIDVMEVITSARYMADSIREALTDNPALLLDVRDALVDSAGTLLVDLTSIILLFELMYAAIMVRKLTQNLADVNAAAISGGSGSEKGGRDAA